MCTWSEENSKVFAGLIISPSNNDIYIYIFQETSRKN